MSGQTSRFEASTVTSANSNVSMYYCWNGKNCSLNARGMCEFRHSKEPTDATNSIMVCDSVDSKVIVTDNKKKVIKTAVVKSNDSKIIMTDSQKKIKEWVLMLDNVIKCFPKEIHGIVAEYLILLPIIFDSSLMARLRHSLFYPSKKIRKCRVSDNDIKCYDMDIHDSILFCMKHPLYISNRKWTFRISRGATTASFKKLTYLNFSYGILHIDEKVEEKLSFPDICNRCKIFCLNAPNFSENSIWESISFIADFEKGIVSVSYDGKNPVPVFLNVHDLENYRPILILHNPSNKINTVSFIMRLSED